MNSTLNPEAPEFQPDVYADELSKVSKTVNSSQRMPSGDSYAMSCTYPEFCDFIYELSENVTEKSNKILITELPNSRLKCLEHDRNVEKVTDANDCMLDRVNIHIDTLRGVNKPSEQLLRGFVGGRNVASWNRGPVLTTVRISSTTSKGTNNITKPQINFKDTIDNSENMFVPKLSEKPNSITPFELKMIYNKEGQEIGYEHPYSHELSVYQPPQMFIEPDPQLPTMPLPIELTKCTIIETAKALDELVVHLETVNEIAVDVEHHSFRTYQGITCLIQITTHDGGDFIIDTLAIRDHIFKLNKAFSDPTKLKVLHGADNDVLWLQRDFGVYIVGLFDTAQAARLLNIRASLKHLLQIYCNIELDKTHQEADWRVRPLPSELIDYARKDTHYLFYLWRMLKKDLYDKAAGSPQLVISVFQQSGLLCLRTYRKRVVTEICHMNIYKHSGKNFNTQQLTALKMLYRWRDTEARRLDENPQYVLPEQMMLALAEKLPREIQGVNAICYSVPSAVKPKLHDIHRIILSCRELPNEPQIYPMPTTLNMMLNTSGRANFPKDEILNSCFSELSDPKDENEDTVEPVDFENKFVADVNIVSCLDNVKSDRSSRLNVEAQMFIPPYDRYRKYRSLAQIEEMKEYREKEAKISAISKGNELIKKEVLEQIEKTKKQLEQTTAPVPTSIEKINDSVSEKKSQRKRKMSIEKIQEKEAANIANKQECKYTPTNSDTTVTTKNIYNNADYKKFSRGSVKGHDMPNTKLKKHK